MIAGSLPPEPQRPLPERLLLSVIVHAILHLPLMFVGALFLAGVLGVIDLARGGGRFAELWVCLPPALFIGLLVGYGYYCWRQRLRRSIQWFRYDDGVLEYETAEGTFTRELLDIAEVGVDTASRRGPHAYRIRFRDGNWSLLSPQTENSSALVEQLRRDGGFQRM